MNIFNTQNNLGDTPLMCAVKNNNLVIIVKLLNYSDIDINIKNNKGYTPYTYALQFCDKCIVEALNHF